MTKDFFDCPHCGRAIVVKQPDKPVPEKYDAVEEQDVFESLDAALAEYAEQLEFTIVGNVHRYKPKQWLGQDTWKQINDRIKLFKGMWVPDKKDSRWEVTQK